jgi:hypothetical protein
LVLTDQTANTNIGLNYNPISNVGSAFNGTGQIFIAHNKGILASNAAGDNYIGVLRPIGTGVYFGGSLTSGELAGDGLFISTTGAATFSSSVTAGGFIRSNNYFQLNNGSENYYWQAATGYMELYDGTDRIVLRAGNTLIGYTTNPSTYKFAVNGTSYFNGAATFSSSVTATTYVASAMPTSSAGLPSGAFWNDGGTLKIV